MEKWSNGLLLTCPMLTTIMNTPAWNSHSRVYCSWTGQTPLQKVKKEPISSQFCFENILNHNISVHELACTWACMLSSVLWVPGCLVGLAVCLSAGPCLLLMVAVFPALFVFFSTVSVAVQTTLKWPTLITLHFLCCLAKQMIMPIYEYTHWNLHTCEDLQIDFPYRKEKSQCSFQLFYLDCIGRSNWDFCFLDLAFD